MAQVTYAESKTKRVVSAVFCALICFIIALPLSAAARELGATDGVRALIVFGCTIIGAVIGFRGKDAK